MRLLTKALDFKPRRPVLFVFIVWDLGYLALTLIDRQLAGTFFLLSLWVVWRGSRP